MKIVYPACFYKEDDGGFSVQFPDLLGCCTQGDTIEEAIQMAEDAALGWLLTSVENNEEIPKASNIKDIKLENEIESRNVRGIVRKIKDYINFSKTLQDALMEKVLKNNRL